MIGRFRDMGFDTARTAMAFRTAIAACIALILAWLLGLDHPQWAGMTVWAATQPVRGQLLEKSFFRAAGTVSGTIAGICLVMASTINPALLVIGLAAWVGVCTFIGNLQRGFVSYGTVLAGYTAAMVALLDVGHPDDVLSLGFDRMLTVLTGVVVATVIGYVFAPSTDRDGLGLRVRELLSDVLNGVAGTAPMSEADKRQLMLRIAEIEAGLDPHAAGSFRTRRETRAIRSLLTNTIPLLLNRGHGAPAPDVAEALRQAANALAAGRIETARRALAAAIDRLPEGNASQAATPEPRRMLTQMQQALNDWLGADIQQTGAAQAPAGNAIRPVPVVLHRDWVGARESMLRASGGLLFFGAIWLFTGWSVGSYMLLGLSIMLSLFSTFDNPAGLMRFVILGQALGVLGALICRWLVWPMAGSEAEMILMMIPFILIGPLFVGHRRTVAVAFDYNMVMLLMLQPHYPLNGTVLTSVASGLAVVAAPFAALITYRLVYPVTLRRKRDTVLQMMLHDLADLAGDADAMRHRDVWQARLYHRTLRMVRLAEMAGRGQDKTLDISLALLDLGAAIQQCHAVLQDPAATPSERRAARYALARAMRIADQPEKAGAAMTGLARRLRSGNADVIHRAGLHAGLLAHAEP